MKQKLIEKYKLDLNAPPPKDKLGVTKVSCPSCNGDIVASDINIHDKIAKCQQCDVIFPIEKAVQSILTPVRAKQEVLQPEGIDLFYFQDALEISLNQGFSSFIDILLYVAAPFAAFFTLIKYLDGAISIIWPAIFIAITLFAIVYAIVGYPKEKTYLTIDPEYLSIDFRPKKLRKDKSYHSEDINQVYIKRYSSDTNYYQVYIIVNGEKGQKHIKLLPNFLSISKAQFLEQEIEKHLGIQDRKVPEEAD